nr:hypothetical protein [bacterium]NIN92818.1 hypothetical protein [bacterium]NIO18773.1 hypothetical protein [bacterium]NIO73854.1 hypothetical protein [bacterium]
MKTKLHIVIIVALSLVWLILSADAAAKDWFVRPAGGNYGTEDGTSYENAWDGLKSVVWGPGGIEAGDTLYICGTFSQNSEALVELLGVRADGTAGQPITIRGDYPGDPGFLIGAYNVTTGWTDNGDGTYWRTDTSVVCAGAVEGTLDGTEELLAKKWSQAQVAATDGSFWLDTDNDKLWYNPHGDTTKTFWGWWYGPIRNYGRDYITYESLTVWFGFTIANIMLEHVSDASGASHVTVNNCSFKYAASYCIGWGARSDNITITNNTFEWFPTALACSGGCYDVVIRGNRFNSGGFYSRSADNGAMQLQVHGNFTIEDNYIEKALGWGIHLYKEKSGIVKSCLIRNNYIQNVIENHEYGTPYGIYISGNNNLDYANRWAGLVISNNIITNLTSTLYEKGGVGIRPKVGVSLDDPNNRMKVINNVISQCDYNIYVFNGFTGGTGAGVILRNNISYNPNPGGHHIYVGTEPTNVLMSNNLWYPDTSNGNNLFEFWPSGVADNHSDFVADAVAYGADVGIGDIVADPRFVSPAPQVPADFKLLLGSPAIDNGMDVGLTQDYDGNIIPQDGDGNGSAEPDIGAYEYVPAGGPVNQPPDIQAIPDNLNKKEGETIQASEIELATDPDGDSLTYTYSGWFSSLPYTTTYNDVGTHTLHLDVTDGIDTIGKDITVTVTSLSANVWFVRPRTGEYGVEDGTSYETGWDGVNSIIWGEGGVDVGDTLYVCGTFDRDGEANPSALIDIKASGVEGHPITIRGDYPGDPGFLVAAKKCSSWTDNGDGTYQAPWPRLGYEAWEGTPGVDDRALKPVNGSAEVAATDGSHWWNSVNKTMWYNPHGNPSSPRTLYSNWYWAVDGNGHSYITLYKLSCYGGQNDRGVIQFDRIGDPITSSYFTVDSCRVKYAAVDGIRNGLPGHHYYIVNNTITDFTVGIYIVHYGGSPDNVTISNNYLDCGAPGYYSYWAGFRGMSDRGAIAMQPGDDYKITDNHIARAVDYGIFAFRFSSSSMKNMHILRNRIDEVSDPFDEYYSFGIGMGGGNDPGAGDNTSGMVIAHNIVKNCKRNSYDKNYGIGLRLSTGKHTDPTTRPLVYGNVVTKCDTNYRLNKTSTPTDESRCEYIFHNNVSYFPNYAHLRIDYAISHDLDMGHNI